MLCIDCARLLNFCILGNLYSFLNPVTTFTIRFVEKQTLHLKYPQCGQPVFTLPAANLISRLQTAGLFLPPVMCYIITTYRGTFMHELFWRYPCQDLEQEKIWVQNAFNITRKGLNDDFDLANPQHRSCIWEVLRFEDSAAQLTVLPCAFASLCVSPGTTKKSIFSGTDVLKARTISIGKEKRGDVEFISMLPITSAEKLANYVCLEGWTHKKVFFFFFFFPLCCLST